MCGIFYGLFFMLNFIFHGLFQLLPGKNVHSIMSIACMNAESDELTIKTGTFQYYFISK